jgi:hypothetical protein
MDYLLREPDAVALLLLLFAVAGALALALRAQRGRLAPVEPGPPPEPPAMVTTWPHLVRLELIAALVALLLVSWWAIALPTTLGPPANPSVTPAVTKAPWFFVGVQEMLHYFDAWLAGVVLPLASVVGLCALPYLDRSGGRRAPRIVVAALLALWLTPMIVGLLARGEHWALQPAWRPSTPDEVQPRALLSLADRLRLGPVSGQLLGGGAVLGPWVMLVALWLPLRRRGWARRLGLGRYLAVGGAALVLLLIVLKVLLVGVADVRYLWITPWFRI